MQSVDWREYARLEQSINDAMARALDRANARIVRQSKVIALLLVALHKMQDQIERRQAAE